MVKHIIIWNIRSDISLEDRNKILPEIENGFKNLPGKIGGLAEIKFIWKKLDSSNGDMLLYSVFDDEAALKRYQNDPEHLKVAELVRSVTCERKCIDYIESEE